MKRVFAFIGFSFAITLILLNIISFKYSLLILIIAGVIFVLSLLLPKIRQAHAVPICFGAAFFACLVFIFVNCNTVIPVQSLDGEYVTVEFQIVDIPVETDRGYAYTVKTKSVDKAGAPQSFKLRVKSDNIIKADYYDTVTADLTLYKIAQSGYSSYGYFGDGIFLSAKIDSYSVEKTDNKPPNYYIILMRERIIDTLNESIGGDEGALSAAVLTGDRSALSYDALNNFNICGAAHLVAVSGLHTSIVCTGLYFLLKKLRISRLPRTAISLFVLFLYIGIADFSKSAMRAGIMLSVVMLAGLINNKADLLNSLGFAVFLMCFNPFAVTDASAVLSVSAVLGIAVIKPVFDKHLKTENKFMRFLLSSVFLTLSVILSTLAPMWLFFGGTSVMGIFLNVVLVPLAQVVLVSALIFVMLSGVPVISFLLKSVCSTASFMMLRITDFCAANFSFADIDMNDSFFGLAIAVLLFYIALSLLITKRVNLKITSYFLIVLFFLSSVFSIYNYNSYAYVKVLSDGCVIVYDKHCSAVIGAEEKGDYYEIKNIAENKDISVVLIDSDNIKEDTGKISTVNADLSTNFDFDIDLCECINVKCIGKEIFISVYDKTVKVGSDEVSTGNYKTFRNINGKFSEDTDYIIEFKENAQTQVRRIDNG